uniref:Uncharacterized protein n=1 Tax=Hyaloperonospora arabidopsidis (strain Emoy2) TaxID=559515 RepID=M4BYX4_HYAAE
MLLLYPTGPEQDWTSRKRRLLVPFLLDDYPRLLCRVIQKGIVHTEACTWRGRVVLAASICAFWRRKMWWSSTKSSLCGSAVEHLSCKQKVPGSIPGGGTPVTRCYCTRLGQNRTGHLESVDCWFRFFWTIIHDYCVGLSRRECHGYRSLSTTAI